MCPFGHTQVQMNTSVSQEIGTRLREERKRKNYSKAEMARKLAVGRSTQIRYEDGTRSPTAEYLARAAAIGIEVAYVLTGKRQATKPSSKANEDIESLINHCIKDFGIEFPFGNACPYSGVKCADCSDQDEWCRWKIVESYDASDVEEPAVPAGHFPWSHLLYNTMKCEVLRDPASTDRERAFVAMIEDYVISVNDCLEDKTNQETCARVLCRLFHASGAFKAQSQ